MAYGINNRKTEQIQICLNENVEGVNKTTGFEDVSFLHHALPEINFNDIQLDTSFLNKPIKTPLLVSSMTGGADAANAINTNLAIAAQQRGWAIALGSTRALLESDDHRESFLIRKHTSSVPLIANIGIVQLNYGYGVEKCQRLVDLTEADALYFHLNSIQEVFQDEGDLNFETLLPKIEKVCESLSVPVGVKEVGFGIDGVVAKKLYDAGVTFIDVAGAGGTSWSQVEKYRSKEPVRKAAAEAFNTWGTPTKDCIISVRNKLKEVPLIASGGMNTGVDAAKAIAIGADMAGYARRLLQSATESAEAVMQTMEQIELEMRIAMFGVGVSTIEELKKTNRVSIKN